MEREERQTTTETDNSKSGNAPEFAGTKIVNTYRPLSSEPGASETSFWTNLAALALSLLCAWGCFINGISDPIELCIVICAGLLFFTVALEALFFRKRSALFALRIRRPLSWRRVFYRELALVATLSAVALLIWLVPAFHEKDTVNNFYPFAGTMLFVLFVFSIPYFCLMDRLDPEEEDAYVLIGKSIATFRPAVPRFILGNHIRSWLVKAFWLSLMQPSMVERIKVFIYYNSHSLPETPAEIYHVASTVIFGLDVSYAAAGYLLNLKLFNTHTRTAEPTLLGWIVAVMCYWPFMDKLVGPYLLSYSGEATWLSVFEPTNAIWYVWCAIIVGCELVYLAATISGGIRFSNLTYRGLWNTGPYRWTKHPAYVFKGLSWWFVGAPFLVEGGASAFKACVAIATLNAIYFLRAKTEERHLSHYPEYVEYALAMNKRSIFRFMARLFPALRYKPLNAISS